MSSLLNILSSNVIRHQHLFCRVSPFTTEAVRNGLKLSDTCVKRLKEICDDKKFLRVTIEGGGCSGFQYKFDIDEKLESDDLVYGPSNARVVIDSTSIEYVDGSTIDFHSELIRSGFRIIHNPKAEQGCSCGASFAIKI
ncbi:iron-sulfur cluster assembly 2 homolog, mitochondrial [Malaya genurostris]|uniref:iron-sulfur cluster assembly 2 homolog, mitochondrial n=1 Tax=Malaya genurostris TaxID=325434 RepID=UPI0026F380BA|nr:iron-sulfur cluster assembly 2 homolog, mitochondrial [Malaya genurostris]